eukprot:CAMPEP_0201508712 /NCGR_PEP_ID=MMETSP0161_2-20130828/1989_1 /ASSEMBLY_ACC=CAM_ASM_000251 /TAXON_ID=180227 /ORGANISM="Neoparamoeba aestuarina, Strain SoJaBio B1-5/56/2" /LENGTH=88 /DNA_ID=CAMNT_0047903455 /DNA_START=328 /DNA_END=594 /DNA_ORIENTATION=-
MPRVVIGYGPLGTSRNDLDNAEHNKEVAEAYCEKEDVEYMEMLEETLHDNPYVHLAHMLGNHAVRYQENSHYDFRNPGNGGKTVKRAR